MSISPYKTFVAGEVLTAAARLIRDHAAAGI